MFSAVFCWAVLGVILMFCELLLPGLILVFFGVGALVTAGIVWLFPLSLAMQGVVFLLASLAFLFGLRRWFRSIFLGRSTAKSEDALPEGLVGSEARVSSSIEPGKPGKVMLNGTAWTAESEECLEEGQRVEVVDQKSLTLIVRGK